MKTLYFDCFSGVSGNMILGGLLSLGVDLSELKAGISGLNISDFDLTVSGVDRSGIRAIHVDTVYEEEKKHRHLPQIEAIIDESKLPESVKTNSKRVFGRLALAESVVHGVDISKIHFHEVGAMDAIIDVVGACIGFEMLEIEEFSCSGIHTGSGFVHTDHGRYPVPPPAVCELLSGIPMYSTEIKGELATPTGAAIIAEFCSSYGAMPVFQTHKTGYGAGTREYEKFPNVLRMIVGETRAKSGKDAETLCRIEANLDDMTGEMLGHLMEEVMSNGALDCWFTSIQMKKNRPATLVSILCKYAQKEKLIELLYTESTTIGVRVDSVERECLNRESHCIETAYGRVDIKIALLNGVVVNVKPEFDQLVGLSRSSGTELKKIISEAAAVCAERYKGARIVGTTATGGSR